MPLNPSGISRLPFDDLIQRLVHLQNHVRMDQKSPVVVSIDIPSGWHVEEGDISGGGVKPNMLVYSDGNLWCVLYSSHFILPHSLIFAPIWSSIL